MRTALRTIILAIREWLPSELFRRSEVGVWYDPSDLTSMYQDSAGTTAAAIESPVGLILDKSQGLVLGATLATNGGFDSDTAWTKGTGWTISGGAANCDGTQASTSLLNQSVSIVITSKYSVEVTVSNYSAGAVSFQLGSQTAISSISSNGTFAVTAAIYTSGPAICYIVANADFVGSIDNVSVRELPGNHATQATSASRPTLSARVNLLTKTEDLANGAWVNGATSGGSRSAGALTLSSSEGYVYIQQTSTLLSTTLLQTVSFDVTCDQTISNVSVRASGNTSVLALVNFVAGVTQRVTLTGYKADSGPALQLGLDARNAIAPGSSDATGYTVTFNKISVVPADQASLPYQRINTATDYDTVGFPTYLKFDGVDDSLATASIDFSAGDKMFVCAGVRKLSDAALGVIAELSAIVDSNAGSWVTYSASSKLYFYNKGSSNVIVEAAAEAPITKVLTTIGDISAPVTTMRFNGVQAVTSATSLGTGNYGNYPLYIGRRGGSSLPFNGHLYSLIVRASQTTDAQIVAAESYVNGKTGAF